jgi:hypothetical protein
MMSVHICIADALRTVSSLSTYIAVQYHACRHCKEKQKTRSVLYYQVQRVACIVQHSTTQQKRSQGTQVYDHMIAYIQHGSVS